MNVEAGIANALHSKKTAPHEDHFFLSLLPLSTLLPLETHVEDTQPFTMDLGVPCDTHSDHMSFWEDRGHIYADLPL